MRVFFDTENLNVRATQFKDCCKLVQAWYDQSIESDTKTQKLEILINKPNLKRTTYRSVIQIVEL